MPIAVCDASQCVLETTPNVPRISGRVVKGGADPAGVRWGAAFMDGVGPLYAAGMIGVSARAGYVAIGLMTFNAGNRPKSRSADHNSRTPC